MTMKSSGYLVPCAGDPLQPSSLALPPCHQCQAVSVLFCWSGGSGGRGPTVFIEGEGQCEAQSSRCVWQGPPTLQNIPPLPGWFFLAVPFISSSAFQLCSVYASSRLVCVRLLFMPHRTVLPVAMPSAVVCGVPRGIGQTPAALGLPLGAGPCRLAISQLGLVLLSVNRY